MAHDVKPDLGAGIPAGDLADGAIVRGQVDGEDAILVRRGSGYFAVGALCPHYHAPLADGLVVDDTIRCPMHHACFSLRTGQALRAPALDPLACWRAERVGDRVYVRERLAPPRPAAIAGRAPQSVVIVGGGAAGLAAADTLRVEGYAGPITMLSADDTAPYDRPNLSKDLLAGTAPPEWMPLRGAEYYADKKIDLVLGERVVSIDVQRRRLRGLRSGETAYGALLLATGAEAVHLDIPASPDARVFYVRTFADARALIAALESARSAVVAGAGFIGLEVAASLRTRGLDVHVAAREPIPFARVLGPELGRFVRELHEAHGVVFHPGCTVSRVDGTRVSLSDGSQLRADVVVAGVGVQPATGLAEAAGIAIDHGILVDEYLETDTPGVFAAGDVARWRDPRSGERLRVEHWVVAQRQGQAAARNMLGQRRAFDAVPFFWSQHYDRTINYVGHAPTWDSTVIDGTPASGDCAVSYRRGDQLLAVATINRDRQNLEAERALESVSPPG